jgi:hypothetical protein
MKKKTENNGIKKKYCCRGKRIWKESTETSINEHEKKVKMQEGRRIKYILFLLGFY